MIEFRFISSLCARREYQDQKRTLIEKSNSHPDSIWVIAHLANIDFGIDPVVVIWSKSYGPVAWRVKISKSENLKKWAADLG